MSEHIFQKYLKHMTLEPIMRPGGKVLKTFVDNFQPQQQLVWCWAAVAVSVNQYYAVKSGQTSEWTQCKLATKRLNQKRKTEGKDLVSSGYCCQNPTPKACKLEAELDFSLRIVGNYSKSSGKPSYKSFDLVQKEIEADRPVGVELHFPGGNHFVSLCGYLSPSIAGGGPQQKDAVEQQQYVVVADSANFGSFGVVPFDIFPTHYDVGAKWFVTYLTQPSTNQKEAENANATS